MLVLMREPWEVDAGTTREEAKRLAAADGRMQPFVQYQKNGVGVDRGRVPRVREAKEARATAFQTNIPARRPFMPFKHTPSLQCELDTNGWVHRCLEKLFFARSFRLPSQFVPAASNTSSDPALEVAKSGPGRAHTWHLISHRAVYATDQNSAMRCPSRTENRLSMARNNV
jgi:hypothetical protein